MHRGLLNKHRPLTTHRGHAEFRPLTAHRGHVVIVTSFEISKCVRLYPCSRGVWFSLLSCLNRDQQGSQRLLRVHSTRVPPMVCLQSTYGSLLTCRVQNPDTQRTGPVGAAHGGQRDGGSWAEQGADSSVGPEANRPSSPPGYHKQLF